MERFWSKVNKTDDCWEWTGYLSSKGYGSIYVNGKQMKAHRYSAQLAGMNITDMFVCHHCDNPRCVRPEHLFVGTNQDNVDDRMRKGRQVNAKYYHSKRVLTNDQAREIRASNLGTKVLANQYGVSQGTVQKIRNNTTYLDVV